MLSKNFDISEFIKQGFAPVTTLQTVYEFQKLRDKANVPIFIHGSEILDKKLFTTGDIKGATNERPALRQLQSIDSQNLPVYGAKAALSDGLIQHLSDIYSSGSTLPDQIRGGKEDPGLYIALLALLQVGYKEKSGNDTVFGSEMGLNKVSWCAIFYHWLVRKLQEVRSDAVYPYKYDSRYSNSRLTFEKAPVSTRQLEEILPGYAIIWARNNHSSTGKTPTGPGMNKRAGHTAVCVHNDTEKKFIVAVEGNTRDGVQLIARYYRNINSKNLEFVGGCSYIKVGAPLNLALVRPGTWTGSVKEDMDSHYT